MPDDTQTEPEATFVSPTAEYFEEHPGELPIDAGSGGDTDLDLPETGLTEQQANAQVKADGGYVTLTYTGEPVALIGHGPISRGKVAVHPDIAKGLVDRPDFRMEPQPKPARKPRARKPKAK